MVGTEAPSIRLKALRLAPSSRIATFSVTPSSLAFATAAFTIFCASSEEMLCFSITLAIGSSPFPPFSESPRQRKPIAEHRPTGLGFGLRRFVLNHVPMLDQESLDH